MANNSDNSNNSNNYINISIMPDDIWENRIDKLDTWDDIKDKLIDLFDKRFKTLKVFNEMKNSNIIRAFSTIKSYKNIYLVFDIEFQTSILNSRYSRSIVGDKNVKGDFYAYFPREFGMIVFVKDRHGKLFYIGNVFNNFVPLYKLKKTKPLVDKDNMRLLISKFSTVTENSRSKMKFIDNSFNLVGMLDTGHPDMDVIDEICNDPLFDLISSHNKKKIIKLYKKIKAKNFGDYYEENSLEDDLKILTKRLRGLIANVQYDSYRKYLKPYHKNLFDEQYGLYYNDDIVKDRMLTESNQKDFIEILIDLSPDSAIIVKGRRDLHALSNISKMHGTKEEFNFNHIYDIETFNGYSKLKFGSAQLEHTYKGIIKSNEYLKNKHDLLEIKRTVDGHAHNPLVDSYYTIVVAVIINVMLNSHNSNRKRKNRDKNNQSGGDNENIGDQDLYMLKYLDRKNKYTKMKNQLLN
jgi:hypothetical protein